MNEIPTDSPGGRLLRRRARLERENARLAARVEKLWRRVSELEGELARLADENAALRAQGTARGQPDAGRLAADQRRLAAQVEELVRVKGLLLTGLQETVGELSAVVEQLEAPLREEEPEPSEAAVEAPVQVAGGEAAAVELDAGPFLDFGALSAFERAVAAVPQVDDVYVRRFAGDRASIELRLREGVDLARQLRDRLGYRVRLTESGPHRIRVDILELVATRPGHAA